MHAVGHNGVTYISPRLVSKYIKHSCLQRNNKKAATRKEQQGPLLLRTLVWCHI